MSKQRGGNGKNGKSGKLQYAVSRKTAARPARPVESPNRRPTRAERTLAIMAGMEWDAKAKRERQAVQPWKGSPEHASILRWAALGGNKRKRT